MKRRPSQMDLVLAHFQNYPNIALSHSDWIDQVTAQCERILGSTPRDLWGAARKLHQEGYLVKVSKGVYMYDPDYVHSPVLEDFTQAQKRESLERDGYRCVICGRGKREGVELHVDHIRPKDVGGSATINNGQTLCAQRNFVKKNLNATETGKKQIIRLYELSKSEQIPEKVAFCREILEVYEKHDVNGHIEWEP